MGIGHQELRDSGMRIADRGFLGVGVGDKGYTPGRRDFPLPRFPVSYPPSEMRNSQSSRALHFQPPTGPTCLYSRFLTDTGEPLGSSSLVGPDAVLPEEGQVDVVPPIQESFPGLGVDVELDVQASLVGEDLTL